MSNNTEKLIAEIDAVFAGMGHVTDTSAVHLRNSEWRQLRDHITALEAKNAAQRELIQSMERHGQALETELQQERSQHGVTEGMAGYCSDQMLQQQERIIKLESALAAKDAALEPFRAMLKLADQVARMDNERINDDDLFAALDAHGYCAKLTWGDLRALTTPDTGEQPRPAADYLAMAHRYRKALEESERQYQRQVQKVLDEMHRADTAEQELERLRQEARDARKAHERAMRETRAAKATTNDLLRDWRAAEREAQTLREFAFSESLYDLLTNLQNGIDSPTTCSDANQLIIWADRLRKALTTEAEQQEAGPRRECVLCGKPITPTEGWIYSDSDQGAIHGSCRNGTGKARSSEGTSQGGDSLQAKYDELLMAVATKHPDETCHETALRYIRQREDGTGGLQGTQQSEGGKSE